MVTWCARPNATAPEDQSLLGYWVLVKILPPNNDWSWSKHIECHYLVIDLKCMVKSIDEMSLAGPLVPHLRFRPGVRTLEMGLLMQGSTTEHSGLLVDAPERLFVWETSREFLTKLEEVAQPDRDCHGNRDQGSTDNSLPGWGGWSHSPSHFFQGTTRPSHSWDNYPWGSIIEQLSSYHPMDNS